MKLFPTDKLYLFILLGLERELSYQMQFDVFRNKYFNHTTTDNPIVCVPSQFYVFDSKTPEREAVTFLKDESEVHNFVEAQCCLCATSKDSLNNILEVLQELQKHVKVITTCLIIEESASVETQTMNTTEIDREITLLKRAIKLSPETLTFCIKNCYLSQSAFKYIVQQLHGCYQLESLSLVSIRQMIPVNLGESVATMEALKILFLHECTMTDTTYQKLMLGLSKCLALTSVHFANSKLTNSLRYFLGGPGHPGFTSLQSLYLSNNQLSKDDVDSLANATMCNKLPNIHWLIVSLNRLTNCLKKLLNITYPFLEGLSLTEDELTPNDFAELLQAIRWNKMPELTSLNIASNNLTGCIKDLFNKSNRVRFKALEELSLSRCCLGTADTKHLFKVIRKLTNCTMLIMEGNKCGGIVEELFLEDGLPFVETLDLKETELNKFDIQSISSAIQQGKLPQLRKLTLDKNNFCGIEGVLEDLFQVCIAYYKRKWITISILRDDVSKPEEFKYKIDSLCAGTMVSLSERQVSILDWIHDLGLYSLTDSGFHTKPLHVTQRDILASVRKTVSHSAML